MAAGYNDSPDWFTIFRTDENDGWLYEELIAGRLRQGWGAPGFGLLDPGRCSGRKDGLGASVQVALER